MWDLRPGDLEDLAWGSTLLGSGGGGSTTLMRMLCEAAMEKSPVVRVASLDEVDAADTIIAVGMVGSPLAFSEKPGTGEEFSSAYYRLREALDVKGPVHVCACETAGVNALVAVLVAAQTGSLLIDCDGMGRALSIHQTTWAAAGVEISPFTLTESHGGSALFRSLSPSASSPYIAQMTVLMGGWAALAGYAQTVGDARTNSVTGSLKRAALFGAQLPKILSSPSAFGEWSSDVSRLGRGRIYQAQSNPIPGGLRSTIVVQLDDPADGTMRIEARNEFLLVLTDGVVTATAPDVIAVVDRRTARPLLVDELRPGYQVDVLRVAAAPIWSSEPYASAGTPGALGLE